MIIARGLLVLVLFCRMRPWFYGLLHEMRDNLSRYTGAPVRLSSCLELGHRQPDPSSQIRAAKSEQPDPSSRSFVEIDWYMSMKYWEKPYSTRTFR